MKLYRKLIIDLIEKQGMSTREIGKAIGIDHSSVVKYSKDDDDKADIKGGTLKLIADYFRVPMADLLEQYDPDKIVINGIPVDLSQLPEPNRNVIERVRTMTPEKAKALLDLLG